MITLSKNGLQKKVSTGYSFKSLLFGCLYPVARGDYKGSFRHFMYCSVSFGLSWFFTPFFYNKKYIKELIEKGYQPNDEKSDEYLVKNVGFTSLFN